MGVGGITCTRKVLPFPASELPLWLQICLHAAIACVWLLFVTLGATQEGLQLTRDPPPRLICPPPPSKAQQKVMQCFHFSADCCVTRRYETVYNILHAVGGTLAFGHLFYPATCVAYKLLFRTFRIVFLFETQLKVVLWSVPTVTLMFTYQHLVYHTFYCHRADGQFCAQRSSASRTLLKVYFSLLTFVVVWIATEIAYVALFVFLFFTKRRGTWKRISHIERSLLFHDTLQQEFETRRALLPTYRFALTAFVEYWTERRDDDIIGMIPQRAARVTRVLCDQMDLDRDGAVSHPEFLVYCLRFGVQHYEELWATLTLGGTYNALTQDAMEDLMYQLFFERKLFAHAVRSDYKIITSIWMYVSMTLYPGCFIVVSKIFEYSDAFGRGVDLFKTYAVIVSFIYSKVVGNVQFLLMMLTERPFDIGDVLLVRGDMFAVTDFTSSHTSMTGPYDLLLSNEHLVHDRVANLTKNNLFDSFDVVVPAASTYEVGDMLRAIDAYMRAHPRDVRPDSVRVTWERTTGDARALRAVWKYKFAILDRQRVLATQARVRNHLMAACTREGIVRSYLAAQVASGGGMNAAAFAREHLEAMQLNWNAAV